MSTSTQSSRALSHHAFAATVSGDGIAPAGPWPGMSSRAALFARTLAVAIVFAWLAMTEPRLLAVFAFAVPFWIATEYEAWRLRRTAAVPARISNLLHVRPSRPSDPGHSPTHRAA